MMKPSVWYISSPPLLLGLLVLCLGIGFVGLSACQNEKGVSPSSPTNAQSANAQPVNGYEGEAHGDDAHGDDHPELAVVMSQMQRWAHKTALSIDAENAALSAFYLHELEETTVEVQRQIPVYEGHDVGQLTATMLVPALERLETAVDAADWRSARDRLADLATTCNQCHTATEHGFIRIRLTELGNPYAQSFTPMRSSGS